MTELNRISPVGREAKRMAVRLNAYLEQLVAETAIGVSPSMPVVVDHLIRQLTPYSLDNCNYLSVGITAEGKLAISCTRWSFQH